MALGFITLESKCKFVSSSSVSVHVHPGQHLWFHKSRFPSKGTIQPINSMVVSPKLNAQNVTKEKSPQEFSSRLSGNESDWHPWDRSFDPWPHSGAWGSGITMSCGVGRRWGSDSELLRLWPWPAAVALTWPLAWELPYATCVALKKAKQNKKQKTPLYFFHIKRKEERKKKESETSILVSSAAFTPLSLLCLCFFFFFFFFSFKVDLF